MQFCARCQGVMLGDTPREVVGTKIYHLYCYWKITVGNQPRVPPRLVNLGEDHDDTTRHRGGSNPRIPEK